MTWLVSLTMLQGTSSELCFVYVLPPMCLQNYTVALAKYRMYNITLAYCRGSDGVHGVSCAGIKPPE